ncbi:MAG: CocE/NonD family hydrolase [Verrucomicrobiaceae bacterium]|nr:MAG: CocE/NonD family hydrolase [Verrucomicrobiaceae bacterium]
MKTLPGGCELWVQPSIRRALMGTCVFLIGITGFAGSCRAEQAADTGIYIEKNVAIPARDGVILRADVRRPKKDGRYPVLIFRTPYDKCEGDEDNEKTFSEAVKRGYAMVVCDVRGRFASDGEFVAYVNEGRDGYDTIEWAAKQPWSDGNVGTFGLSYPCAVQWLAAVESPPHLKAMVPAMGPSSIGPQAIYFGGVFETGWANWCYVNMTPDRRVRKNLPGPKTYDEAKAEWKKLGGADAIQGWIPTLEMPYLRDTEPYYYTWLEHGPYDPWWEWGNMRTKYGNVKAAVLDLSGWHDEPYGSEGAITNFVGLTKARAGEADMRNKLILGPWVHGVYATGKDVAGNRTFGPAAKINYHQVVLDWMDRYVRDIDNGVKNWPNVQAYVMGSDTWKTGDTWPLPGSSAETMFLASTAEPGGKPGALSRQETKDSGFSSFVSDPARPVRDEVDTTWGAFDLRNLANDPAVLTFETEPFAEDTIVLGNLPAEIYASSDAPDFDLYLRILDVAPDGTAFNLEAAGHEVIRASLRDKTPEPKLLKAGDIVKLDFDNLITGNCFKKGHRLRVYIHASWFPTYSRNLQTGKSETSGSETRKATIKVHFGPDTPSKIVLPVFPPTAGR